MLTPADRKNWLERYPRLEIAMMCRGVALTHNEIAKELHRDPGSVTSTSTMVKMGVLILADEIEGTGRGRNAKLFTLTPDRKWRKAAIQLENARSDRLLSSTRAAILIAASDVPRAAGALRTTAGKIAASTVVGGGPIGLIVWPETSGATSSNEFVIAASLAEHGVQAQRVTFGELMDAEATAEWAKAFGVGDQKTIVS